MNTLSLIKFDIISYRDWLKSVDDETLSDDELEKEYMLYLKRNSKKQFEHYRREKEGQNET